MKEDKLQYKHRVFAALLARKHQRFEEISDFQQEQVDSINRADLDESGMVENQTEQMLREARVENESLDHLKEEINRLEDYKAFQLKEKVGTGCVVHSSLGNFVVSVPAHPFEVDNRKYYGISVKSPVYKALEGHGAGEEVVFDQKKIVIEEVL